jgi:ribosomal protein L11 methyltransferase
MDYFEYHFVFCKDEKPFIADLLPTSLAECGFDSFSDASDGIMAYRPATYTDDSDVRSLLLSFEFDKNVTFEKKLIKSKNWNETWEKESFSPVTFCDECVVHSPMSTNVPPLKYDIVVDPKLSFGSGHHETTTLMIERILQTRFDGKSVLDMGCGTAVLAILAYKMGAASVSAIDIDDWAYRNAQTNFEMNGVKNFDLRLGGVDVLPQNQFDYIFANINRNILLEGIPHYVKCMRAGSRLYLSGFYEGDIPVVRGVAEPCGLRYQEDVTKKNEWVSISFEKQ